MYILFFSDFFPPETNAASARVFERACYWIKWGHQVTVITCAPNFPHGKVYPCYKNKLYQAEVMNGIKVIRVKTFITRNQGVVLRTLDFISYMVTAFIAGLFVKKPEVIVANSPQFFAAVGGWGLSTVRNVPFVFELADLWPASIPAVGAMKENIFLRLIEKLELFLYRQSAAVIALTQSFKDDLVRRNIPAEKIAVIINGVDLSRYSPRSRDKELSLKWGLNGCFVIGYLGTHGMAHALEKVLDTAALLKGDPEVRFLFVGAGAAREGLIEEAKRRSLPNVIFIPRQPKEQMPKFWSLCDVALIHLKDTPVFKTVIPSKIFEAMGMGLPLLLVAPEGEASQIVTSEKAGIHIPPGDPEALANAVLNLKNKKSLFRQFAEHSRNAASHYSRERQAKDMITVLEKIISNSNER
jgi:colanic acid biosynthesis glycosyl transferase WcaI